MPPKLAVFSYLFVVVSDLSGTIATSDMYRQTTVDGVCMSWAHGVKVILAR